ncbi:uncharacterized protein RCC_02295 [Lecanosticta acicola]|uniref:Uncharacterized protein RCC_02295 n=1 Tax=Lecanosticta acicola TaxID=111012 RepID=A0AAI8Z126_9PEZI|nr:uncharacterized protein RCC_02295 [Lecanosticta acicola]
MPGYGKQSPEIQEQIKELLEAGFDPTTIHRRLKVGRSSIYRMKRCLQQHGTNYMPPELNKKNGRPKVLTPDQELEVCDWLRDPKNRTRFLDDLVWLIHDRFGTVCSTTTMSKLKRKWSRVIEFEENGTPLDDTTRVQLMETHPDLPILHQQSVPEAQMGVSAQLQPVDMPMQQQQQAGMQAAALQAMAGALEPQLEQQIDSQLEQQLHGEITSFTDSHMQHVGL